MIAVHCRINSYCPAPCCLLLYSCRNYEFDLQLPKPDGSLSTEKFNIPMAFARDGYDVIMKLNPGIDRLIMERSGQVPLEQHIDREWGPWIMHKPNDDKGEWFVFMRLANNIPHFLDALFQVKVACEEEAGRWVCWPDTVSTAVLLCFCSVDGSLLAGVALTYHDHHPC